MVTIVASIIAAESSNKKQVQGITHNTDIVSIDITDQVEGIIKNNALLEGLQIAINEQPDIINLSLGTQLYNKKIHALIKLATEKGIIVVASAGNYMENDLLYPAKYDGVIAVGAVDKNGEILSPKGTLSKPVIYLPGKNVVTAIGKNKYIGAYGSSFSTAIATGMIASSLENACLSKEEIRQKLNSTQTNVVGINDFATLLNMRNQ